MERGFSGGETIAKWGNQANPLQVSHDDGATFKPITAPSEVGKRGASQVWTDLVRPGILYVGAYGGLFAGRFE